MLRPPSTQRTLNPSCMQEVRRAISQKPPTEPVADRLVRRDGSMGTHGPGSKCRRHCAAESDPSGMLLRQRNHTVGRMQASSGDMHSGGTFRKKHARACSSGGACVARSCGQLAEGIRYARRMAATIPLHASPIVHERSGITLSGACFMERWVGRLPYTGSRPALHRSGFEALVRTVIVGFPPIRSLRPFRAVATRRGARVTF